MIRWLTALALILPLQAWGQAAQVTSGDHPDFARIVVQYAGPVDWKMGRTADGYELRLPQGDVQYDLTKAFDLIQKDRLAAIWADPQTGSLHLSIACACFAIPFEFRPGTVVIDIRNGPPPKGSAFEMPLDGDVVRAFPQPASDSPKPRPTTGSVDVYDWTAIAMQPLPATGALPNLDLSAAAAKPAAAPQGLDSLRQSLIEQLSKGASAGIGDMAKPKRTPTMGSDENANPSVQIRLGDAANLTLRQKGEGDTPMTAKGGACFADEQVDVGSWSVDAIPEPVVGVQAEAGKAAPAQQPAAEAVAKNGGGTASPNISIGGPLKKQIAIAMQFAPAMANLTGEFDRPNPVAVKRAVKFDLYIGFGAEARALLRAFPIEEKDQPIWESMARILDEEPDPNPSFVGMEACDTSVALWAVLADPKVLGVGQVQKSAILRAFSALPAHLRRHFGPTLVDRFLAMQDFATATVLRDAVTRGNTETNPQVEMMQAAIDKASGSPGASVARLETVAAQSGPANADALAALVLQRAELGQDVSYDQVRALEEYAKERKGSQDHERFNQVLTLAYASSGDFDSAFANLPNGPAAATTLWKLLGNAGPDSALLNFATLQTGQEPPRAARVSAGLIADRLLRLGLADQAASWLAVANDPPALLAARIAVAQGKPQQALDLLGDQKSPEAIQARLDALHQLGDDPAAAKLFTDLGMAQEHWDAVSRMRDWPSLAANGPDIWKAAAATLAAPPTIPPPVDSSAAQVLPEGPLAQGRALIQESTSTRDAITALLNSVKSPVAPSQ